MSGIDGYDWSIFGGNPVPGDPDAVRAMAARFADLADQVAQQNSLVRRVGADAESIWVGPAASKFHPHLAKLPGQLDKLVTSYGDAATALNGYWPRLQAAQQIAVTALAKAKAAQAAIASAQTQVAAADASASSAASSYNSAVSALAIAAHPLAAQTADVKSLQAGYQAAQSQVSVATAALGAANAQMAAAHQLKDQAVSEARSASRACAAALHTASAAGIQNPHRSWLDAVFDAIGLGTEWHWAKEAGNWVDHHWQQVAVDASEALGVVTGVLAVASLALAPFGVGEALELVNEGLMAVKTGDDLLLAATGDRAAGGFLGEDLLAMGTGGLGRMAADGGEALVATGEVRAAATELDEATQAARLAGDNLAAAQAAVDGAATRVGAAEDNIAILSALRSDALAQGRAADAAGFATQISAQEGARAAAIADGNAAQAARAAAAAELDGARATLGEATSANTKALESLQSAEQYAPSGLGSGARSFVGGNNVTRVSAMFKGGSQYFQDFATERGLTGNAAQRFIKYYAGVFKGSPAIGRAGAGLRIMSVGVNVHEGVSGGQKLANLVSGGGG